MVQQSFSRSMAAVLPPHQQWAVCYYRLKYTFTTSKLKDTLKLVRLPMVPSKTQKSLCGMQQAACCGDQQVRTAHRSCCTLRLQAQASCRVHPSSHLQPGRNCLGVCARDATGCCSGLLLPHFVYSDRE